MSVWLAYVGPDRHRGKSRPVEKGHWRAVCTCRRMLFADGSAESVAQAWRTHVEDEARAAGVQPHYVLKEAVRDSIKRRRDDRAAEMSNREEKSA